MEIRGVWQSTINEALRDVNAAHGSTLQLRTYTALGKANESGHHVKHRLTLRLRDSHDTFHRRSRTCRCRYGYRREHECRGYVMPYVCWHGHREFLRALLRRAPDAIVLAGSIHKGGIRYDGLAGFERDHKATGEFNIGSRMDPLYWADACDCDEASQASDRQRASDAGWDRWARGERPDPDRVDDDEAEPDPAAWTPDSVPSWNPGLEDYGEGAVCAAFATALAATQRERKG